MKHKIHLTLVAALALGTTSLFATNGDLMIGQGAESRAMGGVGIAKSFGAASSLANPANLNSVKNMEITGVATIFMPKVSFASNAAANAQLGAGQSANIAHGDSDATLSVIPEVAFASRVNKNLVYGFSVSGVAGMGADYSKTSFGQSSANNGSFQMKTALSLLKVAVPISYENNGLTLGIAPILQYGSLELSHQRQTSAPGVNPPTFALLSNGASTDMNYGIEIGGTLKNVGTEGLTIGAIFKSKISMEYKDTIADSITAFGGASQTGITSGDSLDQPSEVGFGISYESGNSTFSADYKNIAWGDAVGYKDFGWEDQDVYALGYEYRGSNWALRAGYNYAKSPIVELDGNPNTAGNAAYGNAVKNFFNLSGFPGIVETHYTLGGGYSIGKSLTLDGAFIYVPEVTKTFDTTGMTAGFMANGTNPPSQANWNGNTSTAEVTHSQTVITLAATYKF